MEELNKAVSEVVTYIKETKEYQECLEIKNKMKSNKELTTLIEEVKRVQKKYLRSNYDPKIKEELDILNNKLNDIPIYNIYLDKLNKVNNMIDYVKDDLNDYFYKLLN